MPQQVGDCSRHGRELISQAIVYVEVNPTTKIIEAADEPLCQSHAFRFNRNEFTGVIFVILF
jgi:hypothetical protein